MRRVSVVGAGPNGLTAAAVLARAGIEVDVFERADRVGGACSSARLFGDATVDLGAAAHPFGVASPAFRALGLERHGLEWCHPPIPMAHPLDDAPAALLLPDPAATADQLGRDGDAWLALHAHLVRHLDRHLANVLAPPLRWPAHPGAMARFGATAWPSALALGRRVFGQEPARALLAGSAAHAGVPPSSPLTAAFGLLFGALGMTRGWPFARGGSGAITRALAAEVEAHGGRIHVGQQVRDLGELPPGPVVLSLTPHAVLGLQGLEVRPAVRRRLMRWRHGVASHKVDYLLDGSVPWADARLADAGTVHVAGTVAELEAAERATARGEMPRRPFVLVCQPGAADATRSRSGVVVWAYTHVPAGWREPEPGWVTSLVEAQLERFAPGFTSRVRCRAERTPSQLEAWDANLVGGDIAGGSMAGLQGVLRPGLTLDPHTLRRGGVYLASSATSPGAGVHGMPGWWAARAVIRDASRPSPIWDARARGADRR